MARQMRCKNCGNPNMQIITKTTGKTKGFGAGKGCLGALLVGPFGWLCGLCGMGKGRTTKDAYWVCNQCGRKYKA